MRAGAWIRAQPRSLPDAARQRLLCQLLVPCYLNAYRRLILLTDNVAFDPVIRNVSGTDELEQQYGRFFNYTQNPRALIFARGHSNVTEWVQMLECVPRS